MITFDPHTDIPLFDRRYSVVGEGRHRKVYRLTEYSVLKVPTCPYGLGANEREAELSARDGYGGFIPFARCRLLAGRFLVMEWVERAPSNAYWVGFVDSAQVGYTRSGVLVAFDFG